MWPTLISVPFTVATTVSAVTGSGVSCAIAGVASEKPIAPTRAAFRTRCMDGPSFMPHERATLTVSCAPLTSPLFIEGAPFPVFLWRVGDASKHNPSHDPVRRCDKVKLHARFRNDHEEGLRHPE